MQGLKYTVDIVFCIDATASMGPFINEVKTGALKFEEDLTKLMNCALVRVFTNHFCPVGVFKTKFIYLKRHS